MKPFVGITQAVIDDLRARGIEIDLANRTETRVAGLATRVIDAVEAERAAIVICGDPPSAYPDEDVLTWCHDCHGAIVHRPHAPRAPIKVCARCATRRLAAMVAEDS